MPLENVSRSPRDSRSSSNIPSRTRRSMSSSRSRVSSASVSRSFESKRLPQDGSHGKEIPKLLREPLDPLLDGLLDGRRQRVGGDFRLLGEGPGSGVVLRDSARLDERTDELSGEERIAFRRVAQTPRRARRRRSGLRRATRRRSGAPTEKTAASVIDTKRESSAKDSSIRMSGWRRSVSVCR